MTLTQYQIYTAFNRCIQVYGIHEVHVQLMAKQLGVLASEIVGYVNSNPTLVSYRMNASNSSYSNQILGNEFGGMIITAVTRVPFMFTVSHIKEGDVNPTITLTLDTGTFTNSTSTANWTLDLGTTGLTLASVNSGTASKVLTFSGTAKAGTISIICKSTGITAGVAADIYYFDVDVTAFDYTTIVALTNRVAGLETLVGAEGGASDLMDRVSDLEDYVPIIVELDLSAATENHQLDDVAQHVILEDNHATAVDIVLPVASAIMVGLQISISNQDGESVDVIADGVETINGATTAKTITTLNSATFLCYAVGKWVTV